MKFKFIDLFSGIGGFHQALSLKGGECVFASEIDKDCIDVYYENYGINSNNDITKVEASSIPDHDVLCGGFPCQAFSKAGKQEGINDTRGTLFFEIERILRNKHTKYILLENVRNLVSHDNGYTWSTIQKILKEIGYRLTSEPLVLSPHQFKIPQIRERVYILGKYDPENVDKPLKIHLKKLFSKKENSIEDILEMNADSEYKISKYEEEILNAWDEFYKGIDVKIIGFPIWTEYFKNNENIEIYPEWKKLIIRKNIDLYQRNKTFIDKWLKKYNNLESFAPTHRKFEWQAGTNIQSLWEGIIQLRPSGIRVKKPDCFQALVAIVQIPIIGKYKRRLTIRECARLQSFPESFIPSKNKLQAYKQFGNSVNVEIIKFLFDELIKN